MRFKTLSGKLVYKNISKYRTVWDSDEKSKFQTEVKQFLYPFWKSHLVYSELPLVGTRMTFDLYNSSSQIIIEVQGEQHRSYIQHFAGNRIGYLNQIKRDMQKVKFCEINDIKFVEVFPDDLPLTKEWFLEKYDIYL
jgi:hypothetical protein